MVKSPLEIGPPCPVPYRVAKKGHQHRFSIYRRQHKKIKALLSDSTLSFAAVGKKIGITRERVRQIARQMGMATGRERREQNRLKEQTAAWRARAGTRQVIAKCRELGYTAAPSRRDTPWGWRFEHDILLIHGWRAHVFHIRARGRYFAFTRSDAPADFHIGISPLGFFVVPLKEWKTFPKKTAFAPTACTGGPGFTLSCRHNYLDFLEAWKPMKAKKRS